MRKLVFIAIALMASMGAEADVNLGTVSCDWRGLPHTSGPCGTEFKMENFAMAEAGKKLGCWGEGATCTAVQGETYTLEIEINNTSYCELLHVKFTATASYVPSNPYHYITWINRTLTPWTCTHAHVCMGGDPFD